MYEFALLALLIASAWYWLDSIAKREIAVNTGRDLAGRFSLQLLDETVSCNKIRLGRDSHGHAQLVRDYVFEVSANGTERMPCRLQLLGKHLRDWHIPPYIQADKAEEIDVTPVEADKPSNVYRIH
jgi:Protein of unknown function (DUF3301)